jgi:hypothetical protein
MRNTTTLADSQLTPAPHDVIEVQLVQPDGLPAFVQITWPLHPTVIDPKSFGDAASIVVRLFSTAHVTLARIKGRRRR